jgi:hypothetical protein
MFSVNRADLQARVSNVPERVSCKMFTVNHGSRMWKVRHKNRLLLAVMIELAGDAQIAFEGDLRGLHFDELPVISREASGVLKRQTIWPKQDFVVVALQTESVPAVMKALGGSIPRSVIHIQIAKSERLEFSACDNFHPHAMFFGEALSDAFLDAMKEKEILVPLKA